MNDKISLNYAGYLTHLWTTRYCYSGNLRSWCTYSTTVWHYGSNLITAQINTPVQ